MESSNLAVIDIPKSFRNTTRKISEDTLKELVAKAANSQPGQGVTDGREYPSQSTARNRIYYIQKLVEEDQLLQKGQRLKGRVIKLEEGKYILVLVMIYSNETK